VTYPPAAIGVAEAAAATNRHYDLPPELFETFLGRRMKYTCGLYAGGAATLDEAQEAKLAFIARCLRVGAGESVLDIGTGWGSLAFFLAERFGCQVTAVTPSSTQARYVRDRAAAAGADKRIRVVERSVYDLELPAASFDAVALVGVIEHMPDHHRVLSTAATLLRRGGRLYLSASCFRCRAAFDEYAASPGSRHVLETIFGYGTLRPLSALVEAAEDAGLSLTGITDLTSHYHRTIEDWLAGIRAARERIDAIVPRYAGELVRYLEATNAGWGHTAKHYAFSAVRSRWGYQPDHPGVVAFARKSDHCCRTVPWRNDSLGQEVPR
jgi:cyclopropane-fatty-acyl-phospholipid synthase